MSLSLHPAAIAVAGMSAIQLRWLLQADGILLGFPFLPGLGVFRMRPTQSRTQRLQEVTMTKLHHKFNREAERKKEDELFLWIMFLLILLERLQIREETLSHLNLPKPNWVLS